MANINRLVERFLLWVARIRHKPNQWDAVSIGMFQRLHAAKEFYAQDDIELSIKIASIMYNEPEATIREWPFSKMTSKLRALRWMEKVQPNDFVPDSFEVQGVEYFIVKDFLKLTTAQIVDFSALVKDVSDIIPNMHSVIALFAMPKGQRDHALNFEKRAKLFQYHLSINIASGLSTFFLRLSMGFTASTLSSLTAKARREAGLKKNTDG